MKLELLTKNLTKRLSIINAELIKQIGCDHEFYAYGLGYKCDKCKLYTGTWSEINDIINKNLKEKKWK